MPAIDDDPERLLGSGEAAKLVPCCPRTLIRYVERGWLRAVKLPGPRGTYRYRRDDVLALVREVNGVSA
jgi:helix-turn-helix protein